MKNQDVKFFLYGAVSVSIIYFLTVKKYYNNVGYIKQTILNQALPDNFIKLIKDE